jgi:quinol-cytochrome oxidoreductase complex cytochrome b subunit
MSREAIIGIAAVALAIGVAAIANLSGGVASLGEVLILFGFVLVVATVVFGLVVPWAKNSLDTATSNRPAKAGMVLSALGIITIVAFWSGLPVILGAGGATLGQVGRERAARTGRSGLSLVAMVIGMIAVVGGAGTLILERLGI